jgi:magnesium transporter
LRNLRNFPINCTRWSIAAEEKPDRTDEIRVHSAISVESEPGRTLEIDEELLEELRELLREKATPAIATILTDLHPPDIADLIDHFEPEYRLPIFELLDNETASEVLIELDEKVREDLLEQLPHLRLRGIVDEMDSDDAADVVGELPSEVAERVLDEIDEEDSATLKELLRYPTDSAGGIMATEFIAVRDIDTVQQAIRKVRKMAKEVGEFYNVYVVDDSNVLKGIIPIKDLVIHSPRRRVHKVMETDFHTVDVLIDQEEVANIMKKYDLISVPVINSKGEMLGKITIDDIVDVIHEEAEEDMQKFAGISGMELISHGVWDISRRRMPWLALAFLGQLFSAAILSTFHASIEQIIASAFFIPIIMAMAGNAGIQSSAVVIRGLATEEIWEGMLFRRVLKEAGVALINGLVFSTLIFCVGWLWFNDPLFGVALGLSILIVIANATIVGAAIPFILTRLHIDPAVATGPFITTSNDALGLLIYFGILSLLYI